MHTKWDVSISFKLRIFLNLTEKGTQNKKKKTNQMSNYENVVSMETIYHIHAQT